MINEVVGTDPQRLREFWSDISHNGDKKMQAEVRKLLTAKQRDILQKDYIANVDWSNIKTEGLQDKELIDAQINNQRLAAKRDRVQKEVIILIGEDRKELLLFWAGLSPEIADHLSKSLSEKQLEILFLDVAEQLNKVTQELQTAVDGPEQKKKAEEKYEVVRGNYNRFLLLCENGDNPLLKKVNQKLTAQTKKCLLQSEQAPLDQLCVDLKEAQKQTRDMCDSLAVNVDKIILAEPKPSSELSSYLTKQKALAEAQKKLIELESDLIKLEREEREQSKELGGENIKNFELDKKAIEDKLLPVQKKIEDLKKEVTAAEEKVENTEEKKHVEAVEKAANSIQDSAKLLAVETSQVKRAIADFAIVQRRYGVFSDSSSMSLGDKSRATVSIVNPNSREDAVSEQRDTIKKKEEDDEGKEQQNKLRPSM